MVFIDESIYVIYPFGYDMTSCCLPVARTGRVLLLPSCVFPPPNEQKPSREEAVGIFLEGERSAPPNTNWHRNLGSNLTDLGWTGVSYALNATWPFLHTSVCTDGIGGWARHLHVVGSQNRLDAC